jgi:Tfp pilus assembly protein PilE
MLKIVKTKRQAGDTIVEVLIAIAIAAFAIGTSYAIANRSLQQAITARERNQAVNIIQSQIAALKIRYTYDKTAFQSDDPAKGFVVRSTTINPPASQLPYTDFHFCLVENSASPQDPTNPWARQVNPFTSDSEADNISPTNKYNANCIHNSGAVNYFIDISAQITATSQNAVNRTVYKIVVRWDQAGNSAQAQSVVYYRL